MNGHDLIVCPKGLRQTPVASIFPTDFTNITYPLTSWLKEKKQEILGW